ncbi:DUF4065 domain-containing protein [Bacteroides sp. ET489]|nr:DUF4065 domain-containing protein [Bacteroides sp. ET489]
MAFAKVTKLDKKLRSFEYLLYKFIGWFEKEKRITDDSHALFLADFTRLKVLKLLFLVSAVNEGNDLLSIFDKFYAMRHGPVESEIYDAMVNEKFRFIQFKDRTTSFKQPFDTWAFEDLSSEDKCLLDSAIESLFDKNSSIILYPAMTLVDITHKWISWQSAYMMALMLNKGSQLMDVSLIREDTKYYTK